MSSAARRCTPLSSATYAKSRVVPDGTADCAFEASSTYVTGAAEASRMPLGYTPLATDPSRPYTCDTTSGRPKESSSALRVAADFSDAFDMLKYAMGMR